MSARTQAITSAPSERWELLVLTPEKIEWLWEQCLRFPIIFDDFGKNNKKAYLAKLYDPRNMFMDIGPGLGLGCVMGIKPRLDALIHIVMFDRRLKGREPLFKEMLAYTFNTFQLRRLTAMISEDAVMAEALAKRMGFTHEGTMRKAMLREGRYVDIEIYGLLREEL